MTSSMACIAVLAIATIATVSLTRAFELHDYSEAEAVEYMKDLNHRMSIVENEQTLASWGYASNLTAENLKKEIAASLAFAKFLQAEYQVLIKFPYQNFTDSYLKRQFSKLAILGPYILPEPKYEQLSKVIAEMEEIYSKAKICDYKNKTDCHLSLEPEITEILAESRDADELKSIWTQWRDVSGKKSAKKFEEYVELMNTAAKLNNFEDNSKFWLHDFEADDIREQFQQLWEQIKPFYLQVHAYVRHELRKKYGEEVVSEKGPIPAHLLGNMWAQSWVNIAKHTLPFPEKSPPDITAEMRNQGYTPTKLFKLAEEFFVSLNFSAMPAQFWEKSILEKPKGVDLVCHASAWDFYDSKDFRIKQCTTVTEDQLYTAHHEMGHIQYYLQYKDQPTVFREGANSGFHEAVGDVMSLSVSTSKHLRKIGLIKSADIDPETELNHLYRTTLDKIVFLPFAYLVDLFRWDVFKGVIKPENYNCAWWKLRESYQGLEPPVDRSKDDFDAGAKYHVIANVPYIRYYVSFVIQFQFHKALCEKSGQYVPGDASKPLHECDIYQCQDAGKLLKDMLSMGSSKPWPDAMEAITGQRKMDASGLLEYFKPIMDYIENKNKENGQFIGWESSKREFGCQP